MVEYKGFMRRLHLLIPILLLGIFPQCLRNDCFIADPDCDKQSFYGILYILSPKKNNPDSLPGLTVWLKADKSNLNAGITDGGAVTEWNDSSGAKVSLGRNLKFITGGSCSTSPIFRAGVLNGESAIEFNASTDCLSESQTIPISDLISSYETTYYVVIKEKSPEASTKSILLIWDVVNVYTHKIVNLANQFGFGDRSIPTIAVIQKPSNWLNNYILLEYTITTNLQQVYLNGALVTEIHNQTSAIDISKSSNISIVPFDTVNPGNFFTGFIAEMILYNHALEDLDQKNITCYLADKYALTLPYNCL